jgi:hypothetical protein
MSPHTKHLSYIPIRFSIHQGMSCFSLDVELYHDLTSMDIILFKTYTISLTPSLFMCRLASRGAQSSLTSNFRSPLRRLRRYVYTTSLAVLVDFSSVFSYPIYCIAAIYSLYLSSPLFSTTIILLQPSPLKPLEPNTDSLQPSHSKHIYHSNSFPICLWTAALRQTEVETSTAPCSTIHSLQDRHQYPFRKTSIRHLLGPPRPQDGLIHLGRQRFRARPKARSLMHTRPYLH